MRLIPNTITVSEQFALRYQIDAAIEAWLVEHYGAGSILAWTPDRLKNLEDSCGIRCGYLYGPRQLTGYTLTDEKLYAWFLLKYTGRLP